MPESAAASGPSDKKTIPGTGLPVLPFLALLALSVGLFLFWDGPLWSAPRTASHVGRFAVSYLAVLPFAVGLLWLARAFSWSHLFAATGAVWGIKLVVTSALYFGLAHGTAHMPTSGPLAPLKSAPPVAETVEYNPSRQAFSNGSVAGRALFPGRTPARIAVWLDQPGSGAEEPEGRDVQIRVQTSGATSQYDAPLYLLHTTDRLSVESHDTVLHTFHLFKQGKATLNWPVPAGGHTRPATLEDPGVFEARCDTHASERAAVIVVDHPYAVMADAEGRYELPTVPVGAVTVVSATVSDGKLFVRRVRGRVESGQRSEVNFDFGTPEVDEERL